MSRVTAAADPIGRTSTGDPATAVNPTLLNVHLDGAPARSSRDKLE
jgi:hypothetical protein